MVPALCGTFQVLDWPPNPSSLRADSSVLGFDSVVSAAFRRLWPICSPRARTVSDFRPHAAHTGTVRYRVAAIVGRAELPASSRTWYPGTGTGYRGTFTLNELQVPVAVRAGAYHYRYGYDAKTRRRTRRNGEWE